MNSTRELTLTALFIAIGILLPMVFHMSGGPGAGRIFLPMHIPIFLAGFLAGPSVGLTAGVITPLLSSFLTGMPPLVPTAPMMSAELVVFGLVSGLLYKKQQKPLYVSLIAAMLAGRVVYGLLGAFALPLFGLEQVSLWVPLTSAVTTSWPGVLLQLIFIPAIVKAAENLKAFSSPKPQG